MMRVSWKEKGRQYRFLLVRHAPCLEKKTVHLQPIHGFYEPRTECTHEVSGGAGKRGKTAYSVSTLRARLLWERVCLTVSEGFPTL